MVDIGMQDQGEVFEQPFPVPPGTGSQSFSVEIQLISPGPGEVTAPLQQYAWPDDGWVNPPWNEPEQSWQRYMAESDRSIPRPVQFTWQPVMGAGPSVRYQLDVIQKNDPRNKLTVKNLLDPRAEVNNLMLGMEYEWQVTAYHLQNGFPPSLLAKSLPQAFTTHPAPPRWIKVPGTTNVRDLGGWLLKNGKRIRQGMIYRGSELNSHCILTEEGHRVLIDELGIKTDLDLRGMGEDCRPILDQAQVKYLNIPLMAYDSMVLPECTRYYRNLFGVLSSRMNYPTYMHCWGGADRTGTVAFLVGALLGMSDEDLATDYELTSLSIWGERLRSSEAYKDLTQTLEVFGPKGSSVQVQVERYMKVIGVTEEEIARIRELLTE